MSTYSIESVTQYNSSLMVEKYAWVDERLRELYYGYASTNEDMNPQSNYDEPDFSFLRPASIPWGNYRSGASLGDSDVSSLGKRSRSESDISDYEEDVERVTKRLKCQPESKYTFIPLANPFCNLDCERYNYRANFSIEYENYDSISELDLESEGGYNSPKCSTYVDLELLHNLDKDFHQIRLECNWDDDYDYDHEHDDDMSEKSYKTACDSEFSYREYYDSD